MRYTKRVQISLTNQAIRDRARVIGVKKFTKMEASKVLNTIYSQAKKGFWSDMADIDSHIQNERHATILFTNMNKD